MGFFDDDPYPGDKEIKNLNSFELPLYLFGASIGTLILGFIVHSCCLGSWRKKVESQKLRLERQRIEEIEEEAKHARCVPTDPVRLGKGLKNIDIIYVFLWIALCLAVIASKLMRQKFFDACDRGCSTQWKYLAHFGTVSTASLGVHSGLVPIVLILKCLGFHPSDIIDSLKSKPREQVDEKGGKWRVFSAKMTCCMKVNTRYNTFAYIHRYTVAGCVLDVAGLFLHGWMGTAAREQNSYINCNLPFRRPAHLVFSFAVCRVFRN